MTDLIKSHTVLESSPIMGGNNNRNYYRYRLTIDTNNRYTVHMEYREMGGSLASGEGILYQGDSIETARYVFNRYSN
jgi:hypothetical protein